MSINNIQKVLKSMQKYITSGKRLRKEVNPRFDKREHQHLEVHYKRKKQKITAPSFCFHLTKVNDPSRSTPL